jgi:carboxypeptidase T
MKWFDSRHRARSLGVAAAGALVAVLPLYALPAGAQEADAGAEEASALVLAEVEISTAADVQLLVDLDLDVLDLHDDEAEVLLHGAADRRALGSSGLSAEYVDVTDELAELEDARAAEGRLQALAEHDAALQSTLPTGRQEYRTIEEAEAEIRRIAAENPDIVKLFEMPNTSLLGRTVLGLEISHDVHQDNGKPVFLTTGVHHSREWPTLELTLEFAWDVVQNDGVDEEITGLLESTRLIVVPVVNPDGFDMSRDRVQEMKRKNCRVQAGEIPTEAECADPANHPFGVDLNRNYGSFWGGPGASGNVRAENHYGAHPYSEPEIQNTSTLMSSHQVMVALNNHTPDERLLRAPSSPLEPVPAEVEMYDALAQQLGDALDFPAGPWPEIYYVASGVAEQEALYAHGTFGFTPELTPGHSGLNRFHPPYEFVVDQYSGTGAYEGSSFREASLIAWHAAADPAKHSLITGTAPGNAELTISKDVTVFSSPLANDEVITSGKTIETTMRVPLDGEFEWHVLPSLRQSQSSSTLLQESWTVSCTGWDGEVAQTWDVTIARGQTVDLDLSACPAAGVPDLDALLTAYNDDGTISDRTTANLRDRLVRAQALAETGSETRTIGLLEQFIARVENQVKGDARDAAARAALVQAAQQLIAALESAEADENS